MKPSLDFLKRSHTDASKPHKRLPAWTIPAVIVLGFALLFLALFRDRILPAKDVQVATVLATPAEASSTDGKAGPAPPAKNAPMAFQASGWIEPDPLPIKATALVDGVIDEVYVLEGERVEKGQSLAKLIQDDFTLELAAAKQALILSEAELTAHIHTIAAAEKNIEAAMAMADAAKSVVEEKEDRFQRIKDLPAGALSETETTSIQSAYRNALASHAASLAGVKQAEADKEQLKARIQVLKSAIATAKVDLAVAELALARTTIAAPMDGRVLRLTASPGQKKRLGMDDPDSATIAILYQPDRLQVRVDVPLADAAGLQIGQRTRIRCSLLPNTTFHGEVTRITGEADLQRNTLQAKVRIDDPSDQLRPEMLCRVEFLEAFRRPGSDQTIATGSLATWIPRDALSNETVWVCDPDSKRVESRTVTVGTQEQDGYIRIRDGLRPGEWVVLNPVDLDDGQRVNPNPTH